MNLTINLKKNFVEIFSSKKVIESKILNFLGLQGLRYFFAKFIYFLSSFFYQSSIINKYYSDGIYIEQNFLLENQFQQIKDEFNKVFEVHQIARNVYKNTNVKENSSIDYLLYEFEETEFNKVNFPALTQLLKSQKIKNYFNAAERKKNTCVFMRLEKVKTKDNLKNDANAYWHVDTYHNTHKAWLYLSDITIEHGPFNYIKKSNIFSFKRLIWEIENSIKKLINKNYSPFFFNDKKNIFENKKIEIICKKNTFLLANTHGYHRRGDAKPNMERCSISFFSRENPFKLF